MIEEIIFAGFGGQGILLGGKMIAQASMNQGLNATWFPSYGPEMRGGTANCLVAYSDDEIGSPIFNAYDTALMMNKPSMEKFASHIRPDGTLFVNTSLIETKCERTDIQIIEVAATGLAIDAGDDRAANVVMASAYVAHKGDIKRESLEEVIRTAFAAKGDKIVDLNLRALEAGWNAVQTAAV